MIKDLNFTLTISSEMCQIKDNSTLKMIIGIQMSARVSTTYNLFLFLITISFINIFSLISVLM